MNSSNAAMYCTICFSDMVKTLHLTSQPGASSSRTQCASVKSGLERESECESERPTGLFLLSKEEPGWQKQSGVFWLMFSWTQLEMIQINWTLVWSVHRGEPRIRYHFRNHSLYGSVCNDITAMYQAKVKGQTQRDAPLQTKKPELPNLVPVRRCVRSLSPSSSRTSFSGHAIGSYWTHWEWERLYNARRMRRTTCSRSAYAKLLSKPLVDTNEALDAAILAAHMSAAGATAPRMPSWTPHAERREESGKPTA